MKDIPNVGSLCHENAKRDCIHMALAPVVAGQVLLPGQRVVLDKNHEAVFDTAGTIGIVDPFLQEPVKQGDRFWLFLYPGTITGLRHVFTHPAFAVKVPTKE